MSILVGITLTAVGVALLNKMLKGNIWQPTNSMKWDRESKGQIIDIDEYEIVDENQNRASEGYKVKIDDGDK